MAANILTTFSNAFSWMKMYKCRLRFHWSLVSRVPLTIFQHWFWLWLGADQATSHYLNQWWSVYWRIYASLGLNELSNFFLKTYIWANYNTQKLQFDIIDYLLVYKIASLIKLCLSSFISKTSKYGSRYSPTMTFDISSIGKPIYWSLHESSRHSDASCLCHILTHRGRVKHILASVFSGSDYMVVPVWRHTIIWTNAD